MRIPAELVCGGLYTEHKCYKESAVSVNICDTINEMYMEVIKKKHFLPFLLRGSSTVKRHCIMSSNEIYQLFPLGKLKHLPHFPLSGSCCLGNSFETALVDLRNGFDANGHQLCVL